MNIKDRWTHSEEHQLQQLLQRKKELMEKNTKPLVELVSTTGLRHETSDENIAELLMAHADQFRDALEPFDSGVRAG